MAYERCYDAIGDFERDGTLANAVVIFSALFDECPPKQIPTISLRPGVDVGFYEILIHEQFYNLKNGLPLDEERFDLGFRTESWEEISYFKDLQASMPSVLPPADMIERLDQIDQPSPPYTPDADECTEEMWTAIYIKSAILLAKWMHSGYGDDIPSIHREITALLYGCIGDGHGYSIEGFAFLLMLSFVNRVRAELDFQDQDYQHALMCMTLSIEEYIAAVHHDDEDEGGWIGFGDDTSVRWRCAWLPPWLLDAEDQAKRYLDGLRESRDADWPEIIPILERLFRCFSKHEPWPEDDQSRAHDPSYTEWLFKRLYENEKRAHYWIEAKGWAESQLTPDQRLSLYRDREDEAAIQRLQAYFFTDGLWDELSDRAQRALVGADRALVSATHSRHALIVNELRIAVEETLHESLWKPLSEWAATQRPPDTGLLAVLDKPEQQHRAPGLDDYIQLLWHRGAKAYLEQLGMPDDNIQLLTNPKRATRDLQELQRVRNRAEHEPRAAIGAAEARSLYAKFLGIGRKGVLPELVRALNERRA